MHVLFTGACKIRCFHRVLLPVPGRGTVLGLGISVYTPQGIHACMSELFAVVSGGSMQDAATHAIGAPALCKPTGSVILPAWCVVCCNAGPKM